MFSVKDLAVLRAWRGAAGVMMAAVCMLALTAGLSGCATGGPGEGADYAELYEQGQYEAAYHAGSARARRGDLLDRDEAAYVGGLAAMRIGRLNSAERLLRQASRSRDGSLRGDALANLGLLQYRSGRYEQAADQLTQGAEYLSGEDRAQAYFYAGIAQQRLGRWPQARTSLLLARNTTESESLRQRALDQLSVTGYTVQLGAFSTEENARSAAEEVAERSVEMRFGSPRIVPARSTDGRTMTLVHVGTFSSYQGAYDARARMGVTNAIIVPLAGRTN
ncbi:SPOR domain-containing protein [Phycisphaerales bacterium AB-hyl4]|uniref:SPOR domain-containing protein n=1 Tax=Natronomicrosphaera hydrolytica TaxID=3242702 RepID=A0ABV4UBR4_9BACT